MGRNYDTALYRREVLLIKKHMPNAAISTDIMVGFAGEDDARFEESLNFVKSIGFAKVHIFPFSIRPGTPAEKLSGQVYKKEKNKRAHVLQQAADVSRKEYLNAMIGKKAQVLLETDNSKGVCEGYSGEYVRARVECGAEKIGEIVDVVLYENNIVFD